MSSGQGPVQPGAGGQPVQGQPPPVPPVQRPAAPPATGLQKVGFWTRFVAYLVDMIVVGIPCGIIMAVAGGGIMAAAHMGAPSGAAAGGFGIAQVLLLVISLAYSIGLIGWKGQTVGMMALRIKVVLTTGQPVDYGRAALRWVGSIISGMVLCLGYLWIAWDPDKQAWHDKIAGTYVVKA